MNQQSYRHLLSAVNAAQRELNEEYSSSWDHVTLLTQSGAVVSIDEDTDETIMAMEISTPSAGFSSLWVIDGRGRYAAFPEVGIGSDLHDVLESVGCYNLPVICNTAEDLARTVILGK
jgi:hypothetical protein